MANTQGGRVTWVIDADNKAFKSTLADSENIAAATAASINKSNSRLAQDLNSTFGSIGRILSGGLTAGANTAATALVALGVKGIQTGSYMQSLQLQMNGLTKSVELGAKAMSIAKDYWENNPFQRVDVAATTKTLLAFGRSVNDIAEDLKIVGNVSITTGVPLQSLGSIFGQVAAQGRLMGGDIVQLTQNGVAILPALQKMLGKTADEVRDMASEGQISFAQFKKAMESLVDPNIVKQMENTIPRQLDRLQGSVTSLSFAFVGAIADAKVGVVAEGNGLLQAVTTLVKNIADSLRLKEVTESAKAAGAAFVPLVNALSSLFVVVDGQSKIGNFLIGFFDTIAKLGPAIIPIVALMALQFSNLFSQIPIVGDLLGGLSNSFNSLGDAIGGALGSSTQSVLSAFGLVISNIVPSIEKLVQASIFGFQKIVDGAKALKAVGGGAMSLFQSAAITTIDAISRRFPAFGDAIYGVSSRFDDAVSKIKGNISAARASVELNILAMTENFKTSHPFITAFASKIKDGIGGAVDFVVPKIKSLAGNVASFTKDAIDKSLSFVGNGVARIGGMFADMARNIGGAILNGAIAVGTAAATLGPEFGKTVDGVINSIVTKGPQMVSAFTENIKLMADRVTDNLPALTTAFQTIFTTISTFIINNGPTLIQSFVNVVITLINSIASPANITMLVTATITLFTSIVNAIFQIAPVLLDAFFKVVIEIVNQLANPETLGKLVDNTVNFVLKIAEILITNLPTLINAMFTLMLALVDKMTQPDVLDRLISATVQLIVVIATALIENLPKLIEAAVKIIVALAQAFTKKENLDKIWQAVKTIAQKIIDTIIQTDWMKLGGDIVRGLWNGINNLGAWIGQKIKGFGDGVMKGLKDFFGIKSPSRLMRDEIGKNLGLGIASGITLSTKSAVQAATNSAAQISGAFNPLADSSFSTDYNVSGSLAPVSVADYERDFSASGNKIEIQQNNTINTEVDMDKVTRDLTWELSRA